MLRDLHTIIASQFITVNFPGRLNERHWIEVNKEGYLETMYAQFMLHGTEGKEKYPPFHMLITMLTIFSVCTLASTRDKSNGLKKHIKSHSVESDNKKDH